MQAYIDDSASQTGECVLWLAGYLNSAGDWAMFSQAWDDELKQAPSIGYLKMSEALFFKGEFKGWDTAQRDEKLRGFARVIRHFQPASFGMSISLAQFDKWVSGKGPHGLSAYYLCAHMVIQKVAEFAKSRDLIPPIDFFFDQHDGLNSTLNLVKDALVENMPRQQRRMVGGAFFRDDKDVLPIQAADMLAWYLRRTDEGSDTSFLSIGLSEIVGVEHFESKIPEDALQHFGAEFSKFPRQVMPDSRIKWKKFRRDLTAAKARGFIPPYGTKWKNIIARLIGYPRIPR